MRELTNIEINAVSGGIVLWDKFITGNMSGFLANRAASPFEHDSMTGELPKQSRPAWQHPKTWVSRPGQVERSN